MTEEDDLLFRGSKKPEDPEDPLFPDIKDKYYSKKVYWDKIWELWNNNK